MFLEGIQQGRRVSIRSGYITARTGDHASSGTNARMASKSEQAFGIQRNDSGYTLRPFPRIDAETVTVPTLQRL